jgi:cytoskeletal protein CcmA (bactofilin family)
VGDIKTARIVIEDGAYFKGSIDIARPEIAKPAAPPAQQTKAASAATPSAHATPAPAAATAGDSSR